MPTPVKRFVPILVVVPAALYFVVQHIDAGGGEHVVVPSMPLVAVFLLLRSCYREDFRSFIIAVLQSWLLSAVLVYWFLGQYRAFGPVLVAVLSVAMLVNAGAASALHAGIRSLPDTLGKWRTTRLCTAAFCVVTALSFLSGNSLDKRTTMQLHKHSTLSARVSDYLDRHDFSAVAAADLPMEALNTDLHPVVDGTVTHDLGGSLEIRSSGSTSTIAYHDVPRGLACRLFIQAGRNMGHGFPDISIDGFDMPREQAYAKHAQPLMDECERGGDPVVVRFHGTEKSMSRASYGIERRLQNPTPWLR